MPFCPICGNQLVSADVRFCPACGNEIGDKLKALNSSSLNQTVRPPTSENSSFNTTGPNFPSENRYIPQTSVPNVGYSSGMGSQSGYIPQSNVMPMGVRFVGFGDRLIAYIIDMIVLNVFSFLIGLILPLPSIDPLALIDMNGNIDMGAFQNYMLVNTLITFIFSMIYYFVCYMGLKGKTVGKAALKIITVDADTLEPMIQPGKIFLDSILKATGLILLDLIIGAIANPGQKQQFRIMQKAAHTAVIKTTM
jgi:uncharacterized RDD family membrane protein YckC